MVSPVAPASRPYIASMQLTPTETPEAGAPQGASPPGLSSQVVPPPSDILTQAIQSTADSDMPTQQELMDATQIFYLGKLSRLIHTQSS